MIRIRKAMRKDVGLLVELWKEFMNYHDDVVIKVRPDLKEHLAKDRKGAENFKGFVSGKIKDKNAIVLIAEVDGKTAGYSLAYIKDNVPVFKVKKLGYLSDLFVRKEFRGLHISTKLVNEAIEFFKKNKMKFVSIAVYNDNEYARNIYKKWGFKEFHVELRKKIK